MGQPSPPTSPQRSQFYNVVCGGTWLNRQQWDDAVAQFKTTNATFSDVQAQTLNVQRQTEAPTFSRLRPTLNLEVVPAFLRPLVQTVIAPAYALFATLQQRLQTAIAEVTGPRVPGQRNLQQEPTALAQMLSYFFGWRREARPTSLLTEDEQQARAQTDFLAGMTETFQLNKVGKSSGSSLSGGGGQGGQTSP